MKQRTYPQAARSTRTLSIEPLEPRAMLSASGVLPGDYNADGSVNAMDYAVWREALGAANGSLPNDPSGGTPGVIGDAQLQTWINNYGATSQVLTSRAMEYLDRGVVATRTSSTGVFISWRLFADDPADVLFNIYRVGGPPSGGGGLAPLESGAAPPPGPTTKPNGTPISLTNYSDVLPDANYDYSYYVRPVHGGVVGVEQEASGEFLLESTAAAGPYYIVPMRDIGNYDLRHVSIGDLNGDGNYDFVVGRRPPGGTASQVVDAYLHDGTFLWSVDLGPNSFDTYNIEPSSTTVDVGNWDGIQVYDLDLDGKAEVFLRTANGVTFADGQTVTHSNDNLQFISAVDGMTGVERARIQLPDDYIADGPLAAMTGIGYLDGQRPSLVLKLKNRVGSGHFNMMVAAYDFDGALTEKWIWKRDSQILADGHNIRIADVDGDGKDEIADIGFVLNGDGTLKYSLTEHGIVHGDRFYIGDFDPGRPGLEGYGVQQNNPSGLAEYYYDAATGEILHEVYYTSGTGDNGRGEIGDIDPNLPGFEFWSYSPGGYYNSYTATAGQPPQLTTNPSITSNPTPGVSLYWDGDLLTETLSTDSEVINKYNPSTGGSNRLTTLWALGSGATDQDGYPIYFGDITGDWREEVIYERSDRQALVVFTSQYATSERLYSLAQNPLYRNNLSLKGYLQSRNVDYYLGTGMATPPAPDTHVVQFGADNAPTVATPAAASASVVTGTTVNLSALGLDDYGQAGLTYTWAALGNDPVTYSDNRTNSAKDTVATFSAAGEYKFVVTIRDASGQTVSSRTSTVVVNQVQSGMAVTPSEGVMAPGGTRQFGAAVVDQFGNAMPSQPNFTWAVISGGGSINNSGLYTAAGSAGTATIQASANSLGLSSTAQVTLSDDIAPVAWWTLDNLTGDQLADSTGNGQSATAAGGPSVTAGQIDGALSFDGSDDYVALPTPMVDSAAGSISLWIKTGTNFSDAAHLFYASPEGGGNGGGAETELHLSFLNNETLQFFIRGEGASSTNVNIATSATYANNQWHHIAATWDNSGVARLYVDGAIVGTDTHDALAFTGTLVARLGRPGTDSRYFQGQMDDVRLYDVAIGATQVQALFNMTSPVPQLQNGFWLSVEPTATADEPSLAEVSPRLDHATPSSDTLLHHLSQAHSNALRLPTAIEIAFEEIEESEARERSQPDAVGVQWATAATRV